MQTEKGPRAEPKGAATKRRAGGVKREQRAEVPARRRPGKAREITPPRTIEAKVVAIGNSRGVRLPRAVLAKYAIGDAVLLEEREDGLLVRGKSDERLSWEDTYKAMAREREDFRDLDVTIGDGLDKDLW
jgi:antitoxin MazE